jgi:muramoyltetrapeptide carboxypeptidase
LRKAFFLRGINLSRLIVFSPAGVVAQPAAVRRAVKRLQGHGFEVELHTTALARHQRFAGDDAQRLAALHDVAQAAPSIALATRGGYGLMRLLDHIDWPLIARSIEQGTRWVGFSDCTLLQLASLAHGIWPQPALHDHDHSHHHHHHHHHHENDCCQHGGFWHGPMACETFGRTDAEGGIDDVTEGCFLEAMSGALEAIGFRTEKGFEGLTCEGRLWGGNLTLVNALLGTPHFPDVEGGILFLEDVNEHPYRIERHLLQLHQAGVLDAQQAVLLGEFTDWKASPLDRGYTLKTTVSYLRSVCKTPILTGLPVGHVATQVCLPQGQQTTLKIEGRDVFLFF